MPFLIQYLLKLSISLAVVFLFYQLFLRRLTFYNWNRYYLIGYSLLSFFIPFINISPLVENKNSEHVQVINYIPVINNYVPARAIVTAAQSYVFNYWDMMLTIIFIGSFIMLVRLCIHFFSLRKIKKYATIINAGEAAVYQVNENIIPFSFGSAIFINQQLHTEKEFEEIILHEYVHVKQNHTLDILFGELLCIINWFNPFVWLIRHSIRQNLEFIADDFVLKNGFDKKAYQYHLLKVVGAPQYRIANNFNFSSLRKRIVMMNKLKSAKLHLIKFLFMLPLIAVLLVAFRDKYKNIFEKNFLVCNIKGMVIDASTNAPLANVIVEESTAAIIATTNEQGIYSFSVPLKNDSLKLNFNLKKIGYNDVSYGYNYRGKYSGFANVMGMFDTATKVIHKVMMFMPGGKTYNSNPDSKDLADLYGEVVKQNKEGQALIDFNNRYSDFTFFSGEDKQRQIVISKEGVVEKYGFPNGPTIADMEKKYGQLPDMFTNPKYGGGKDYVARWQKISEEAEKKFHTANPNVKEIIFPGDSRVIVVLKNGGKPKMYDMDNAVPEERLAFEKLYGSLDGIVPPAANYANGAHNDARYKDWTISGIMFLGFEKIDFDRENSVTHFIGQGNLVISNSAKALIIYHNKEYDLNIFKVQFGNIKIGDALIYENEGAFKKFGEKGRHGVIVIAENGKAQNANGFNNLKTDTLEPKVSTVHNKPVTSISLHRHDKMDDAHKKFFEINPSVLLLHWELEKDELDIYLVHSKVEKYDLKKNRQKIVDKYGSVPSPVAGSYGTSTSFQDSKGNGLHNYNDIPSNTDASLNAPGYNSNITIKPTTVNAIYIIDGIEIPHGINWANLINPSAIKSMNVLKGEMATKKYGDKGKNGVIEITTNMLTKNKLDTILNTPRIVRVEQIPGKVNPLYIVDGKEAMDIGDLNPNQIESITVLKDSSVIKQFGEKGRNGVIIIKTKNVEKRNDTIAPPSSQKQINISAKELESKKWELFRVYQQKCTLIDDSLKIWNSPYLFASGNKSLSDKIIDELIREREKLVSELETGMKNIDPQIEKDIWMKKEIEIEQYHNYSERQSYETYHLLHLKSDTELKLYFVNFMQEHIDHQNENYNFIPVNLIVDDPGLTRLSEKYNALQSARQADPQGKIVSVKINHRDLDVDLPKFKAVYAQRLDGIAGTLKKINNLN